MLQEKLLRLLNLFYKNLLLLFGLCSICFVFQACYGTDSADFMPQKKELGNSDSLSLSTDYNQYDYQLSPDDLTD